MRMVLPPRSAMISPSTSRRCCHTGGNAGTIYCWCGRMLCSPRSVPQLERREAVSGVLHTLRRRAPFFATMLGLAAGVGFLVYYVQAQASIRSIAASSAQRVASEENGDYAHVGWKVRMLSGLDVTLVAVEKSGATWRFHFTIANPSNTAATARGPDLPTPADRSANQTALDHQFVIGVYPRSLTPEYRPLSATPATDRSHPALAGWLTLRAGQRADGWLQVDVTQSVGLPPNQLLYIHNPKPSMKCQDPADQSTCMPETAYEVMIWLI